jgi:hypothetical protein
MAKYNLTITENQGQVLCKALELLSRIYMGQLGDIAFQVFAGMQDTDRYCKLRDGLEALETLATGLERNAFHGIYSDKISDVARIAWDLDFFLASEGYAELIPSAPLVHPSCPESLTGFS